MRYSLIKKHVTRPILSVSRKWNVIVEEEIGNYATMREAIEEANRKSQDCIDSLSTFSRYCRAMRVLSNFGHTRAAIDFMILFRKQKVIFYIRETK